MDEKVLEEIQFHQDTVGRDANSPLHLIREKEMEISGRVMATRKQAEEIVAQARKKAVEVTRGAEAEGTSMASKREKVVLVEVEREIEQINAGAEKEIEALHQLIDERADKAATFVVETVTGV
ncbi:MAG: V-type ATPase subunit subunit G family protein [Coriobacteriia bacterium]|nr:V-type ATPase subunit subunit G family protein [Coriobacteriia bacterium]